MYARTLGSQLPTAASCLILGPRQTGKSTLIETLPCLLAIDLLSAATFLKYNHNPDLLFAEVSSLPAGVQGNVWIDEIQKVPALLDVVHRCIERFPAVHFILTGSSARKLRRGAANLLGGRAVSFALHPLTCVELGGDFQLERVLQYGSLPRIYSLLVEHNEALAQELLRSYVTTYLNEEIKSEAIARRLDSFQSFLEVAVSQFAEEVNLSTLAVESRVSQPTVRNYYSILEDTLIGFFLPPYTRSIRKRLSKRSKFYVFDNGVTRAMLGLVSVPISPIERGRLFEQWIMQEVRRVNDYFRKDLKMYFWRTHNGAEVDLLLTRGREILIAVECKSGAALARQDFSGLRSFSEEHPTVPVYLCAPVDLDREAERSVRVIRPQTLFDLIKAL
jgi:uncharacterized protein